MLHDTALYETTIDIDIYIMHMFSAFLINVKL